MKKTALIILSVIMLVCLVSCSDDGVPKGMKISSDNSVVDYILYVPEEWTVDEMSTFSRAHAENSISSVSVFTYSVSADTEISDWWSTSFLPSISTSLENVSSLDSGKETMVDKKFAIAYEITSQIIEGEGDNATVTNYKHKITAVKNGESIYVIWYNGTVSEKSDYYTASLESLDKILSEFKFSPVKPNSVTENQADENTPEGMKLASNKSIVLYSLYVPSTWIVDESSAMTLAHVSNENKSSISVMQWNLTQDSLSVDAWWENYHQKELSSTFDTFTVTEQGTPYTVDGREGKAYSYTVEFSGQVYKYFVVSVIDQGSIHVITYTSTPELYEETLSVVKDQILSSFRFR